MTKEYLGRSQQADTQQINESTEPIGFVTLYARDGEVKESVPYQKEEMVDTFDPRAGQVIDGVYYQADFF